MNNQPEARLNEIHNFRLLDGRIGTAGQPTAAQFADIRRAEFKVVINLAMPDSDNAIENEGSIVSGHGMSYVHIPVDFESPRTEEYRLFRSVMDACADRRVLVHCAANKRVSVYLYLYRTQRGLSHDEAWRDVLALWSPDRTWTDFMADVRDAENRK